MDAPSALGHPRRFRSSEWVPLFVLACRSAFLDGYVRIKARCQSVWEGREVCNGLARGFSRSRAAADRGKGLGGRRWTATFGSPLRATIWIAVGHNINQVGSVHGDYLVVNVAGNLPVPTPRTRPIDQRGRDFPDLLGRREEIRAVRWAVRAAQPVELIAPPGMGKSVLLRHLAFRLPALPDGVVWLSAANRPYDDLLEKLFDAFFQTPLPVKLPADDLLRYLSGINALLLVDDVDLSRDEVGALLAALPRAALVLASHERRLWGQGRAIPLGGLALDEGMALFARQVGRSLRPHEEGEVRRLVTFGGSPLAIRQSALDGLVVPELKLSLRWLRSTARRRSWNI